LRFVYPQKLKREPKLIVPGTTSTTAWKILEKGVDVSVTVSDAAVHGDVQYLHEQGVKNGPCGAAPLSALKRLCEERRSELSLDKNSVVVLFSTEGARSYVDPTQA
jgi:diaminopropionate ammonia-lyase